MTPTDLTCPKCGKTFNPSRKWQRFCGPICQTRYHSEKARNKRLSDANRLAELEAELSLLKGKNEAAPS